MVWAPARLDLRPAAARERRGRDVAGPGHRDGVRPAGASGAARNPDRIRLSGARRSEPVGDSGDTRARRIDSRPDELVIVERRHRKPCRLCAAARTDRSERHRRVRTAAGRRVVRGAGGVGECSLQRIFGLHAKSFVFDETTLYVGSMNLNMRSAYLNAESALIIESPELARAVAGAITLNMQPQNSWHVMLRRRPDDVDDRSRRRGRRDAAGARYAVVAQNAVGIHRDAAAREVSVSGLHWRTPCQMIASGVRKHR